MTNLEILACRIAVADWFTARAIPGSNLEAHERKMRDAAWLDFHDEASERNAPIGEVVDAIESATQWINEAKLTLLQRN